MTLSTWCLDSCCRWDTMTAHTFSFFVRIFGGSSQQHGCSAMLRHTLTSCMSQQWLLHGPKGQSISTDLDSMDVACIVEQETMIAHWTAWRCSPAVTEAHLS